MKSIVNIIDELDVTRAIPLALEGLAGLEELFKGKHVTIKPNETWASASDLTACTQANSVDSLITFVKRYNPGRITVSGGSGAGETDKIFKLLGIDKVIKKQKVEFFDHNRGPFKEIKLDYGPQKEVMVNPYVLEYDTLISLAQHKVHNSATVTLTMKNIAMSYPAADYYGHPRERFLHQHNFFKDLQGFITGMCQRFRIGLGIIVGHPAMTQRGPIGGRTFESGITIASLDFVACDYVGAKILGYDNVGHISQAAELGLGNAELKDIEIKYVKLEEAKKIFQSRAK